MKLKLKHPNHRKPLKYQRFVDNIESEEIVAYHSRDDYDKLDHRAGERTFGEAKRSMERKNLILPHLSEQDLQINQMFQTELERQRAIIARIRKIRVVVDSMPGKGTELIMNKDISTPYDCARHIHELLTTRSVVAEVLTTADQSSESQEVVTEDSNNNKSEETNQLTLTHSEPKKTIYWDMSRPLEKDCRIRFRHFTDDNVSEVNKIYWRSCSFVLGMAVRVAFKDGIQVMPHSWPKPDIQSGSFVYDVALNLGSKWKPADSELRAFTKVMWEIKSAALPFERLQVNREVARTLFSNNPFKLAQIDSIIGNESSQGKVTIYRCGGLLDISVGPMISNTSQIGRISLAAVHPFESKADDYKGIFYRFQGVSLPQQLPVSSYLYQNVLLSRARELNRASL